MSPLKTTALLTTLAVFAAQSALALTLEQLNVSNGNGVFVPAIIVTDGPSAGTYKVGDKGLTHWIIYNPAALRAWAAQMAGVELSTVKIYERDYSTPTDDCAYDTSFDAGLTPDHLIYTQADLIAINPCYVPCEKMGYLPTSTGDSLILIQWDPCWMPDYS